MRARTSVAAVAATLTTAFAVAAQTPSAAATSDTTSGRPRLSLSVPAAPSGSGKVGVAPLIRSVANVSFDRPPTTAQCRAQIQISCYAPGQLQRAYDMTPLYNAGLTGRGRTIVIVDSFGSPTIRRDLAAFDRAIGLPAPPKLSVIQPVGKVPPYDASDGTRVGWAFETTLDVEWAHAMAPGAKILLVETPVAETEGAVGIPQIVKAENYVINRHMGDVISQSFAATEATFRSEQRLRSLRGSFKNAAANKVTVVSASGDQGATGARFSGNLFTRRAAQWPSSDPLVTSVGGTQLHLDARGDRIAPDNVWNDQALFQSAAAGGGGLSSVFARPTYQDSVRGVVGHRRGTPDISLSAAVDGGLLIKSSFGGLTPGFHIVGGTSAATPLLAGIVAIGAQAAGHPLGLLNPRLYRLAQRHAPGIIDITRGNNTVTFTQNRKTYTVRGFRARSGYDLASGLGTVDGTALVKELSR